MLTQTMGLFLDFQLFVSRIFRFWTFLVSKTEHSFYFFKKVVGNHVERWLLVDFGVFQENSNDVDEGNYAEDEEPFVLVRSLSTSASEVNPKHIHDEDHCDFIIWCSGKSEDIPKHEWGG